MGEKTFKPSSILIYVVTILILVVIVCLLFKLFIGYEAAVNPCGVCMESNPALEKCVEQMRYTTQGNNPLVVANFSFPEADLT